MAELKVGIRLDALTSSQRLLMSLLGFADDSKMLDPIRIMKALFIVCKKSPPEYLGGMPPYEFHPYLYGPYSEQVYQDLSELEELNLIQKVAVPGRTWSYYVPTEKGKEISGSAISAYDDKLRRYIQKIYDFVQGRDFAALLGEVYRAFPEYAVRSVFRRQA